MSCHSKRRMQLIRHEEQRQAKKHHQGVKLLQKQIKAQSKKGAT